MKDQEWNEKFDQLQGEIGAIHTLFQELLAKADKNLEKTEQTFDQARLGKHNAGNIAANMQGFNEATMRQYEKNEEQHKELKIVLEELRHERDLNRQQIDKNNDLVEESQRQVKEIAGFIQSLQQVGTIKMWQDVITSVNDGKRFQDKFSFAAFFFGGIIVLVGLISAVIGAYEKLSSYFK